VFCRFKIHVFLAQIATLILLLLHDAPFKREFTSFLLKRYSRLLRLSEELPSVANSWIASRSTCSTNRSDSAQ